MKDFQTVEHLFETKVVPKLEYLESKRRNVKRSYYWGLGLTIITIIPNIIGTFYGIPPVGLTFPLIIGLIAWFELKRLVKDYRAEYKRLVVKEIVASIDPTWSYFPNKSVSILEFSHSKLFQQPCERITGDDLIIGTIDKTTFYSGEIHAQRSNSLNSDYDTIFKGLFFSADFNKHFRNETLVLPNTADKALGALGRKIQKYKIGENFVEMEDIEFAKKFMVLSNDDIEARYLLTPALMKAILNIKSRYYGSVYLSFIDSMVYCAISFNDNLFEPSIVKTNLTIENVKSMFNLFMMNATIIEELNLNTRIWTKE